ncbi:MAG: deoxyguanosinetriphosphate triphosphohydrolase [Aestuariivita sp.]|nr:deoxyguanosinetriphosphate triphosphohydrolase [Aestuariivita sp.]MCY4203203.1 deoxyguanosinetriphosphate triphosphohydrolase [Aestuariivita sp.]MCY4289063.1 deoxyguanosinetriphosphate triphosphohydrolase [Aestuariivita sp.]MCY4345753.1 deoxyguanosinetriphosphate triphosphohydrolase [Aestuariivita sp.]
MLAPYASDPEQSRGRRVPEQASIFRSEFQRDRDRIIHSTAFRRLKHKTQVFVEHEGDHYRTRLTHSLEVAQVARTVAAALQLNSDLTEAVALSHDLGHPPFGHAGEEVLHTLMQPYGGFEHNAHSLKIVTKLEQNYADFDGLNLTWETLEALCKHNGPVRQAVSYVLADSNNLYDLELHSYASAEGQVAAIADDIAYINHDLQDGLRASLFGEDDLRSLPILREAYQEVDARYQNLAVQRRQHEALRRVFGAMVGDVIVHARKLLTESGARSAEGIRKLNHPVITFSSTMQSDLSSLREFLSARMYQAPIIERRLREARSVVEKLFSLYLERHEYLPEPWRIEIEAANENTAAARTVSDYIAGMTDRFAIHEYVRLTNSRPKDLFVD